MEEEIINDEELEEDQKISILTQMGYDQIDIFELALRVARETQERRYF